MLVKCPKCGFSQPQDQYCAQCGVDMIAFKPPQKSAVSSLIKDPLFHISLFLIVALLSTVLWHNHNKSEMAQRVTYLKGNSFPQRIMSPNSDRAAASGQPGQGNQVVGNSNGSLATTAGAVPPPPPPTAASFDGSKKTKTISAVKVKVIYAEVSSRVYDSILEESSKSGQFNNFGDYSAGIISSGAQRKISGAGSEIKILRTDLDPIDIGKSLNWSFNYRGSEREPASSEISLSTYVNLEDADNQIFKGNLEIVRSQKESVDPSLASIQKNNYPAVFELPQDGAFFMSGLGTRRPAGLEATKPDTELVIFVMFEKGS